MGRDAYRMSARHRTEPSGVTCSSPAELFARLAELGIAVRTCEHAPVFTVAESASIKGALPGAHSKNLFMKDRRGRLFLVVANDDAAIDLKRLHDVLGA